MTNYRTSVKLLGEFQMQQTLYIHTHNVSTLTYGSFTSRLHRPFLHVHVVAQMSLSVYLSCLDPVKLLIHDTVLRLFVVNHLIVK